MSRNRLFLVLFLVFTVGMRWVTAPRLLPQSWTSDSEVVITARVLEEPYLTERNYIIRLGRVMAVFSSPVSIEVGEYIELIGKADVRVTGKKQVQVVLYDPQIRVVIPGVNEKDSIVDNLRVVLVKMRQKMVRVLQINLPEPHASLAAGILLGVRAQMPNDFYQALVNTGTLHVIAASGYNVAIVLRVVMGVVMLFVTRGVGLVIGFVFVALYVVVAGGSAAVVRAAVMGILTYSAYFWGRPAEAKRLLWIVSWGMLMISPLLVVDVGFQLSVAATYGILYWEPKIRAFGVKRYQKFHNGPLGEYLAENLYPTLAASMSTLPVILWWFGRVSWISPIVNVLVLGLVPLMMFLAGLAVGVGMIMPFMGKLVAYLLYVPSEVFVRVIELFG